MSLFATSCRNEELPHTETSNSPSENESFISISGKLAQAYVDNATIILDRKLSGSHKGNCTQDAGEGKTHSDPFGVFSISDSHHDLFKISNLSGFSILELKKTANILHKKGLLSLAEKYK